MFVGITLESSPTTTISSADGADEMAVYLTAVAVSRCQQSFARVFNYFAPRLMSYAMKQIRNEALAMELVQDTMTNVWQKSHLFDASKGSASTWIFTIARNIRFDLLRKQRNRKEDICADDLWPVLCEQTGDPNEVAHDDQVSFDQLSELIHVLPDKQRQVIEAIYIEGKSQQEVADEMDIPLGTVKSRTRLALLRLKEMMTQHD